MSFDVGVEERNESAFGVLGGPEVACRSARKMGAAGVNLQPSRD